MWLAIPSTRNRATERFPMVAISVNSFNELKMSPKVIVEGTDTLGPTSILSAWKDFVTPSL